jgi:hypothetical protein
MGGFAHLHLPLPASVVQGQGGFTIQCQLIVGIHNFGGIDSIARVEGHINRQAIAKQAN